MEPVKGHQEIKVEQLFKDGKDDQYNVLTLQDLDQVPPEDTGDTDVKFHY